MSGEHPTLPSAEVKALLRASDEKWGTVESRPQLLRVEATSSAVLHVAARAAYTRGAYREVLRTVNRREDILRKTASVNFGPYLQPGRTFNVRVARLRGSSRHLSTLDLEKSLGSVILGKVESSKVSFRRPNVSFEGFLAENIFLLGVPLNYSRLSLKDRSPRRKPFFHPSSLHPKLARCLVNLTEPREGDFVVDPFCGTGSIPLEACLLGFESVAGDIQRRMVEGSRANLNYYGCRDYHLVVADAMQL
ncbi:MAG: THUMP domain-containing protein, partial [Candidatus Bathyarchaeia archaeon]